MGRPTILVDELPTGHRWDADDNLVRWEQAANGATVHLAMPESLFRQATFHALTTLRRIDKRRRARAENSASEGETVVPLRRREDR
jgi:hypothetical protein